MLRKINVKYIKLAYYFAIYDIIKQETEWNKCYY